MLTDIRLGVARIHLGVLQCTPRHTTAEINMNRYVSEHSEKQESDKQARQYKVRKKRRKIKPIHRKPEAKSIKSSNLRSISWES